MTCALPIRSTASDYFYERAEELREEKRLLLLENQQLRRRIAAYEQAYGAPPVPRHECCGRCHRA